MRHLLETVFFGVVIYHKVVRGTLGHKIIVQLLPEAIIIKDILRVKLVATCIHFVRHILDAF